MKNKEQVMVDHIIIPRICDRIRDSFEGAEEVYTQGSCVKFAMILKEIYPTGTILYDHNHAIFEYEGVCFDINGIAKKTEHHLPLNHLGCNKMYDIMSSKYGKLKTYLYDNNQETIPEHKDQDDS